MRFIQGIRLCRVLLSPFLAPLRLSAQCLQVSVKSCFPITFYEMPDIPASFIKLVLPGEFSRRFVNAW